MGLSFMIVLYALYPFILHSVLLMCSCNWVIDLTHSSSNLLGVLKQSRWTTESEGYGRMYGLRVAVLFSRMQ
jgi:hypothetical protein